MANTRPETFFRRISGMIAQPGPYSKRQETQGDAMTNPSDCDRALWQRYRRDLPAPARPDVLDLAAYAEGRLTGPTLAAVELALARDPDLLETVLAARHATEAAPPVPLTTIRRARALIPSPTGPRRLASWASIAAALVLVCISGFQAGYSAAGSANELNQPIELANWTAGDADGLD